MSNNNKGAGWRGITSGVKQNHRGPYAVVAEECGVSSRTVRNVCGTIGTAAIDQVSTDDRIAVLRRKMEMANFNLIKNTQPDLEEEPGVRELRTCILCENFLEDDDAGKDVVNGEDYTEHAVICVACRRSHSRI